MFDVNQSKPRKFRVKARNPWICLTALWLALPMTSLTQETSNTDEAEKTAASEPEAVSEEIISQETSAPEKAPELTRQVPNLLDITVIDGPDEGIIIEETLRQGMGSDEGIVIEETLRQGMGPDFNDELTVAELHEKFMLNFTGEQHPEAADLAETIVSRLERELGPEAPELVVPLNNLATVQEILGEWGAAEQNYLRSINIVEIHQGQYHADLIRPLTGLGLTYQSGGRHKEAIGTFQRAQHVTHRKDGVFSREQLDLLDRISENYVAINEYGEADRAQRLWFKINERNFGSDNVEVLPALEKLADWYVRSGQYANAVNAHNRSIKILENKYGENDLRLLKPLRGIAQAGNGRGRTNSQSTKALERADKILAQNPDAEPTERALTLIELADIYTITNKVAPAAEHYSQAWDVLSLRDDGLAAQQELLGQPVKLFHPVLYMSDDAFVRRRKGEYFVEIEFVVKPDGHVTDVKVIDADAPAEARRSVRQMARRARYRPRHENGIAIATEGVTYKQKVLIVDQDQQCTTFGGCRAGSSQFP